MLSRPALARSAAWLALLTVGLSGGAACAPEGHGDDEGEDHEHESPEPSEKSNEALSSGTVQQAAANGCSTLAVRGLSLQIIEEGNRITPNAYAEIPSRPNFRPSEVVFPFLEGPAREKLVAALDANPGKTMTVSSMLRTVAQQYMLYRWYQQGRCGISLAAKPGNSNHETGLAIDISEHASWKSALTSRGFGWLGNADKPHFDYRGAGAVDHRGLDVLAFQRLWNRNHPDDPIDEDGDYGPQTENRLKQAPANGFPIGPGDDGGADDDGASGDDGGGDGGADDPPESTPPGDEPAAGCADACSEGAARAASCDACSADVCAADDYCCTTAWDAACVVLAGDSASCGCTASGGSGGGADPEPEPGCAHDEWQAGAALDAACSPCAGAVCDLDAFCCDTEWDDACVDAAMEMCE